jgi:hypothetical protein
MICRLLPLRLLGSGAALLRLLVGIRLLIP